MFEKEFFHWITYKAIRNLIEDDYLEVEETQTRDRQRVNFVFRSGLAVKQVRVHIRNAVTLLEQAWATPLSATRGKHLEVLVKQELRANGLTIAGEHTNTYQGVTWSETEHDLDYIAEVGKGIALGIEVKNTMPYIPRQELDAKLEMCRHLGIRPVFAVRWMPKSYIYKAYRAGGFGWLFEHQAYPLGTEGLCERLNQRLRFPARVTPELPPHAQRLFANWISRLRSAGA